MFIMFLFHKYKFCKMKNYLQVRASFPQRCSGKVSISSCDTTTSFASLMVWYTNRLEMGILVGNTSISSIMMGITLWALPSLPPFNALITLPLSANITFRIQIIIDYVLIHNTNRNGNVTFRIKKKLCLILQYYQNGNVN